MYIFLLLLIYICKICKCASQKLPQGLYCASGNKLATGPWGCWSAYVIPRGLGKIYKINTLNPKLYTKPQFYVQNWGFVKGVTCGAIIFITTPRRNWGKYSKLIYIKKDSKYKGTVSECQPASKNILPLR